VTASHGENWRNDFVIVIIFALYGGVAGMFIRRFGIPKAVANPVIPYVLSIVLFWLTTFGTLLPRQQALIPVIAIFVSPVMCSWLAF